MTTSRCAGMMPTATSDLVLTLLFPEVPGIRYAVAAFLLDNGAAPAPSRISSRALPVKVTAAASIHTDLVGG